MPLVVPGVTANQLGDSKTQEWMLKLMGKTFTGEISTSDASSVTHFSMKDLPEGSRVLEPGAARTADYEPDRLNVIVDGSGTVVDVYTDKGIVLRSQGRK